MARRRFVGYVSDGAHSVGCTGQTVYLLDGCGEELAKFKDLKYAYTPCISPNGELFVVKSTEGRLAVYSVNPPALIKKFRFSSVAASQDDNMCFSPDGRYFYNIERHIDSTKTALSVFDTSDFSLVARVLGEDFGRVLTAIEYDEVDGVMLLGFERERSSGVAYKYFVGRLRGDELSDVVYISEREHEYYRDIKDMQIHGGGYALGEYTPKEALAMTSCKHTLASIWRYYFDKKQSN